MHSMRTTNVHSKQVPENERLGSQIIFRQGNPLLMDNLEQLNVDAAAAVVVVSDSGKDATAADAQTMRVAILLDEMRTKSGRSAEAARQGVVVVELLDPASIHILEYSCSRRVVALPSGLINARRCACIALVCIRISAVHVVADLHSHMQQHKCTGSR